MQLSTIAPLWMLIFCLLLALIAAAMLYMRNKRNEIKTAWSITLFILRFLSVFFISLLLLQPFLRKWKTYSKKAVVVVAVDQSESMRYGADSLGFAQKIQDQIEELKQEIKADVDFKVIGFGDQVKQVEDSFQFNQKITNFSKLFTEVSHRYSDQNVGAMIVASDGIQNRGMNPMYSSDNYDFPVYFIGYGDTTSYKDVSIKNVFANKVVRINNSFFIQLDVEAKAYKGRSSQLSIYGQSGLVYSKQLRFNSDYEVLTEYVELQADNAGMQRYRCVIEVFDDEQNKRNNQKSLFIEVIEQQKKVVLLYDAPHPDIGSFSQVFQDKKSYDFKSVHINDLKETVSDIDLLIAYQIPSNKNTANTVFEQAKKWEVPILFVLGQNSSLTSFNKLESGLKIISSKQSITESQAHFNKSFSLFNYTPDDDLLNQLPPLSVPFGTYNIVKKNDVLFSQKIKGVNMDLPLVTFLDQGGFKYGVISGEGLWRWRIRNFILKQDHEDFDDLMLKMTQLLTVNISKDRLNLSYRTAYDENEDIVLKATFYNDNYELDNKAEIKMRLRSEEDESLDYIFLPSNNGYSLNLGQLTPGEYRLNASTNYQGEDYKAGGKFLIRKIETELQNLQADHYFLQQLADHFGGQFATQDDRTMIIDHLNSREDIKSISYRNKQIHKFLDIPFILGLVLLLLILEWFIRKWLSI